MTRILVTGVGGIGGNNFVRALRLAEKQRETKLFIVGTDHNPYYLQMPQVNVRSVSPRHDDSKFVPTLLKLIKKYKVQFIHPHPSGEARIVSESLSLFEDAGARTYLSKSSSIAPDKLEMFDALSRHGVPTPNAIMINSLDDVDDAFSKIGQAIWIRAKTGAGGRLGLKVNTPEEAKLWAKFNVLQGRANIDDFILQEYLSGKDLAFDSLWFKGKLVTSYARERLEYPLKHVSLSGITATPSVAKIIDDEQVNRIGIDAVNALNPKPHGFFSVDIKCNATGDPLVTETDSKWHTTAPLWGYAFAKAFNKPEVNIADLYLTLGLSGELKEELPRTNLFPSNYYLIRQLDAGVILKCDDRIWKIL